MEAEEENQIILPPPVMDRNYDVAISPEQQRAILLPRQQSETELTPAQLEQFERYLSHEREYENSLISRMKDGLTSYMPKIKEYLNYIFFLPPQVPPQVPSQIPQQVQQYSKVTVILSNVCHGALQIYEDGTFITGHINIELVRLIIAPKNTCSWGDYKEHNALFSALLKLYPDNIDHVFRCLQGYFSNYDISLRDKSKFSRDSKKASDKKVGQMIGSVHDEYGSTYQLIRTNAQNEVINKIWSIDNPNPFNRDGVWTTTSRGILVMKKFVMTLPRIFATELEKVPAKKFIASMKSQINKVTIDQNNANTILEETYKFNDRIGIFNENTKTITYQKDADIMACPYFIFFNIFILANKSSLTVSEINDVLQSNIIDLNFPAWRNDLYNQDRGSINPVKNGKIYMLNRTTALITYAYFEMVHEVYMYDTSCEAIYRHDSTLMKIAMKHGGIINYISTVHSNPDLRGGKKTNTRKKLKTRRKKNKNRKMRKTKKH